MPATPLLHHHLVGPAGAPPLILGPSLGTSRAVWEPQLPSLGGRFQVLRFDLPGHGGSTSAALPQPEPGRTTVGHLAALVLSLADHHGWDRFHYAGISLGGAIGAHLAARHPGRITSLALVCSSAHFGAAQPWNERAGLVRLRGTAPLLETSPSRWFATADGAETPFGRRLLGNLADADPIGYAACCDALASYDLRHELAVISAPTLVVGGTLDTATPLEHAKELARGIPHAVLKTIACGHLAAEQPGHCKTCSPHTCAPPVWNPGQGFPGPADSGPTGAVVKRRISAAAEAAVATGGPTGRRAGATPGVAARPSGESERRRHGIPCGTARAGEWPSRAAFYETIVRRMTQ
ncbi:alpha/beta fold hydrolase [Streptomyces mirabilis]|uniref:alpha/beta fold hydrolase n=1 Tax=Streptomyces mirabilis TaxID=68239 RepID=UPI003662DED8